MTTTDDQDAGKTSIAEGEVWPPEHDSRFTFELLVRVGEVLEQRGYPRLAGRAAVDLQQHLWQFLYIEGHGRGTDDDQDSTDQGGDQ